MAHSSSTADYIETMESLAAYAQEHMAKISSVHEAPAQSRDLIQNVVDEHMTDMFATEDVFEKIGLYKKALTLLATHNIPYDDGLSSYGTTYRTLWEDLVKQCLAESLFSTDPEEKEKLFYTARRYLPITQLLIGELGYSTEELYVDIAGAYYDVFEETTDPQKDGLANNIIRVLHEGRLDVSKGLGKLNTSQQALYETVAEGYLIKMLAAPKFEERYELFDRVQKNLSKSGTKLGDFLQKQDVSQDDIYMDFAKRFYNQLTDKDPAANREQYMDSIIACFEIAHCTEEEGFKAFGTDREQVYYSLACLYNRDLQNAKTGDEMNVCFIGMERTIDRGNLSRDLTKVAFGYDRVRTCYQVAKRYHREMDLSLQPVTKEDRFGKLISLFERNKIDPKDGFQKLDTSLNEVHLTLGQAYFDAIYETPSPLDMMNCFHEAKRHFGQASVGWAAYVGIPEPTFQRNILERAHRLFGPQQHSKG